MILAAALLVGLSLVLAYAVHAPALWIFLAAGAAIIPLAEWIRRATDQMAKLAGPAIGSLLNVTFGNAAELILALFVLEEGKQAVVKGQITGSIIGNSLLGLGVSILVGSRGRHRQTFNRERAGQLGSLLILAVIALLLPAVFDLTERSVLRAAHPTRQVEFLSLGVAVVLIAVYLANLVYTLITHRDVFAMEKEKKGEEKEGEKDEKNGNPWPLWMALGVLVGATALTAWEAELVSSALERAAGSLGLTPFFLGVTVLALIGNAAEYASAVYYASQNRLGLTLRLTVGSSLQVALLVAPLLVLISYALGHPMNLVFSPLELIAIFGVAFGVNAIAQDGETTWFEGVLLIALYALLALAFFFAQTV